GSSYFTAEPGKSLGQAPRILCPENDSHCPSGALSPVDDQSWDRAVWTSGNRSGNPLCRLRSQSARPANPPDLSPRGTDLSLSAQPLLGRRPGGRDRSVPRLVILSGR